MRLWHKDLIPVLPKQQLLGQWRECCCIARNIAVNGTPNHLLVNKVMDYPAGHLYLYGAEVVGEMRKRGYNADFYKFNRYFEPFPHISGHNELFKHWHDDRYLLQCYYNLQEKYDCGGITEDEWKVIELWMKKRKQELQHQ